LRDRGAHYGDFRDQACLAQALKETMHDTEGWVDKLNDAQREALDMIQHKVSRILNGDPNYKDSWTDIIGYAKLIEETLT
jgi:hypothetical protein